MFLSLLAFTALAADEFEGFRFYYGDIHSHTGASGDGGSSDIGACTRFSTGDPGVCGAYVDVGTVARANGLDFFASLDHVTSAGATTTVENFEAVFQHVNGLNDPEGGLVTIPGAEVFVELPDGSDVGHRSLLFFGDEATLSGLVMTDAQPSGSLSNQVSECSVLTTFMDALTARMGPALLLPHHPGVKKPMTTDWSCFDAEYEPAVEVYSEHGSSMDAESTFDIPWSGYAASGTVLAGLDPRGGGLRFGFAAGSDNHDSHPGQTCGIDTVQDQPYGSGLTVVVLDAVETFDRPAIYAAFRDRKTYATTGPMLPLVVEVRLPDGSFVAAMGEAVPFANGQDIVVEARVPGDVAATVVSAIALGPDVAWPMVATVAGAWQVTIPAVELPEHLFVDLEVDAAAWWPSGCVDGGDSTFDHVWGSPIWFDPLDGDTDRDGYSPADGDCDDGDERVHPGAEEACAQPEADQNCDGVLAADDPDCVRDPGDTADTGADTAESADDTVPIFDTHDSGDAVEPGPTHRCACDSGNASFAGGVVLLAIAMSARRRR